MKTYFLIILTVCLLTPMLEASVFVGKEIYIKECLHCHLSGKALASHKRAKAWKKLFTLEDGTNKLATIHLTLKETKASWIYFGSDTYLKETKHLKDFMQKYSSDRGKHNSCN